MASRGVWRVKRRKKNITCLTSSAQKSKLLKPRALNISPMLAISSPFLTGNSVKLPFLNNLIVTTNPSVKKIPQKTNLRRKKRRYKKRKRSLKLNTERSLRSQRRNIKWRSKKMKMKMRTRNWTKSLRKMRRMRRMKNLRKTRKRKKSAQRRSKRK